MRRSSRAVFVSIAGPSRGQSVDVVHAGVKTYVQTLRLGRRQASNAIMISIVSNIVQKLSLTPVPVSVYKPTMPLCLTQRHKEGFPRLCPISVSMVLYHSEYTRLCTHSNYNHVLAISITADSINKKLSQAGPGSTHTHG